MPTFPLKPAAGRAMGVTYKMVKLPPDAAPCVPTGLQLAWFTDGAGTFSETAEAAYLLPVGEGAAGPVLGIAGIIGETCGAKIFWAAAWTPESGSGGNPGVYEDGARLIIWPKPDTEPGILTVTARVDNKNYGPIALTVLRYACLPYYDFYVDPLTWIDGNTYITDYRDGPTFNPTAIVTGTWPPGTSFAWTHTTGLAGFTVSIADNTLSVSYLEPSEGTFIASCVVTIPTGKQWAVGPITLRVLPY